MPNGYNGKILHVDLTQGLLTVEEPKEAFYRKYLGGSAMGMHYILRDMPKGADALSPENVLTLFTGVTTGAAISGQSRLNANAKSPISGGIGDSQSGGFFPAELKFAGFDGIVIKGKSEKPVYLAIIEGKYELRDAAHLMGKLTGEVDDMIHKEVDPKAEILQHGIGAENGVLFSSLCSMSNRHNGRTGMGLVMASKNLKAVVVRGTKRIQLADQKSLVELNRTGPKMLPENGDMDGLAKFGTAVVVLFNNTLGTLPTRNYTEGQFEGCEPISGEKMAETILKERDTCYACVVKCKRVVEINDGPYKVSPRYGGPEYETLGTFGSYCGVDDLAAVSMANQICNEYAVDSIAAGATIAFAMECYEKGVITKEQTNGLDLKFGNADAMIQALYMLVKGEGEFGRTLGMGSERAATVWGKGSDEFLITVKGAESPAHMPQAKRSLALIYAVNPFGADHQSSEHDPYYEDGIGDFNLDRLKVLGLGSPQPAYSLTEEKVRFAYETEVFYSMMDSAELCQFVYGPTWTLYGPNETVSMMNSVTGWDLTVEELMTVGRRRLDLFRTFNAREGLGRKDDKLPKKFFKALSGTGPTAGLALTHEEVDTAIDHYYKLSGYTSDGVPTRETLQKHDIEWAAEYLPV
ncbi:aldehyde ferredoxin oxidoreductase family protein [Candidatus Villigracilis saccharophilus]|uniref:aldehyde ferredoxin oxidoreductase family protein n=1 Tax=Candidatus Villigracilis saccharophilus TaxID=3140684 RepID=UPI00313636E6|nr:aldehyde ferredoxin oxidoreductase family protein [Anaerolineales bacterium]